MRDSASYLMYFEIAILFIRSAIIHSFQKNPYTSFPAKECPHFEKKKSRFLWHGVLKLRFCL